MPSTKKEKRRKLDRSFAQDSASSARIVGMRYLSKLPRAVVWVIAVIAVFAAIATCDSLSVKWALERAAENADHKSAHTVFP